MLAGFRHMIWGRVLILLHLKRIYMVLVGPELVRSLAGGNTFPGVAAFGQVYNPDPPVPFQPLPPSDLQHFRDMLFGFDHIGGINLHQGAVGRQEFQPFGVFRLALLERET